MTTKTYLLLDLATVLPPLVFSVHPRIRFYRHWRFFMPALLLSAIVFVLWDMYFTWLGVWGFNRNYLTGLKLANLPLEEWLFFLCIPYACVFTSFCRRLAGGTGPGPRTERLITISLILVLLIAAGSNIHRRYTATAFLSLSALLAYASMNLKKGSLSRFYISWLFLLLPLFIVDGILTGTGIQQPVVWYNPQDILGLRILTIPIEDVFYGMGMVLLNVVVFHRLQQFHHRNIPPSAIIDLV